MVFGFGSSSSSSSSSSNPNEPPPAPLREERKACWAGRDAYFDCLNANNVIIPGDENKVDGKEVKGGASICSAEREKYQKNCGQTWVRRWRCRSDTRERK